METGILPRQLPRVPVSFIINPAIKATIKIGINPLILIGG